MDNELKQYTHIISNIKHGILRLATKTKMDIDSSYFWNTVDGWIDKFLQEYPYKEEHNLTENIQKKLKKYILRLVRDMLNNSKFRRTIESIREKQAEIEKLAKDIEVLSKESITMFSEREKLDNYISFEGINQILTSNGKEEASANTLSKWNSKGLLGEGLTEKDICPNSFENHRIVYFQKEKVLDFLIKEGKITPKYEILDQIEEGTVLGYVITKDNSLGYYCKDFDTGIETIVK